ncbi:ketosteroid isomerase-like protein [Alcanivorax nanhaiticus]|uniref:Ketosteroid isomerase-like protein n=1 Tax=Alcanivorax nanhaiticus TaxID=1177154 RepID=A0A095SJT2_9GAMM|nr:nuclear transport factor 2 family protein [Alcanivorax nanhaiticus]KGD64842.1 ketosteroid isomerase-like protein [Alcanivorax nanhaiticus]
MTSNTTPQDSIREMAARWLDAIKAKDREGVLAMYSPSIRSFDVIFAQQVQGEEDYRQHWDRCMALCPGEPLFEMYDVTITVEGQLAVTHGLFKCGCEDENGEQKTGWMRGTLVWQQQGGEWLIVHEHLSNTYDPVSGDLITDWQPDHVPVPLMPVHTHS